MDWDINSVNLFSTQQFKYLQDEEYSKWLKNGWLIRHGNNVSINNKQTPPENYTSDYIQLFPTFDLAIQYLQHLDNPLNHTCKICGKIIPPRNINSYKFKSNCSPECKIIATKQTINVDKDFYKKRAEKTKQTNIERYNNPGFNNRQKAKNTIEKILLDNPDYYKNITAKVKQTMTAKYGQENYHNITALKETRERHIKENPNYLHDIQEKRKSTIKNIIKNKPDYKKCIELKKRKTLNERYGSENYYNTKKSKETWSNKTKEDINQIQNKIKQTRLIKYGDENYTNREKCNKTMLERYGAPFYSQTSDFRNQLINTNLSKYGVKSYSATNECKEKVRQTCIKKYGCPSYSQSPIAAKNRKGRYLYNNLMFDSSWELYFYIYHKEVLKNIIIRNPEVNFSYKVGIMEKTYHPDFYLPKEGKYVEIKGGHFLKENKNGIIKMICPFDMNKDDEYNAKYKCMLENNIKILSGDEIQPIINTVKEKLGKHYINQFKINS